jgi:small-conductance mechanosensitive channel/CRP-like cAMP-binding protein
METAIPCATGIKRRTVETLELIPVRYGFVMDQSLAFCLALIADPVALRFIPKRRRIVRMVVRSIFFAVQTFFIVGLVRSPLSPVYRPRQLPEEFWLQILVCLWWGLAARELISFLRFFTALQKTSLENKLLSDIVAASIYICATLAMMAFVLGLPLQGLVATSGIIAIVLGLALQSTLGDVFSGISLSIEKPYRIGDEILLEGGAEGEVIEINWRSTHLRNSANDVVIVPNSAIAKLRIQNHSAGTRRYSGSLSVSVDNRNEPELTRELLKQAALSCPSIIEHPAPSADATDIRGDRVVYAINFSTASISSAGEARSQFLTQIYKRACPSLGQAGLSSLAAVGRNSTESCPVFFFPESEVLNHLPVLEPLSDAEKAQQLIAQGAEVNSAHFLFSGVVQITRQVQDGRALDVKRLGPGDSFGDMSLLTGLQSFGTYTTVTSGHLLELRAEDLKPIIEARPELIESLSHSAAKAQQFVAMFDKAALQPSVMAQPDLLSRIKNFFRLSAEDLNQNAKSSGVRW